MSGFSGQKIGKLLSVTKEASQTLSFFVKEVYHAMGYGKVATLKADSSAFTIADGIVQHLLTQLLTGKVKHIVGEEDESDINIVSAPYKVSELTVPESFYDIINQTRESILSLRSNVFIIFITFIIHYSLFIIHYYYHNLID